MRQATKMDKFTGQHVERIRKHYKKTREDVAQAIGVSGNQIQKYERGINRITVGRLYDLAEAIGVSVFELLPSPTKTDKLGRIMYEEEK